MQFCCRAFCLMGVNRHGQWLCTCPTRQILHSLRCSTWSQIKGRPDTGHSFNYYKPAPAHLHQSGSWLPNVKRNVEYLHHDFNRKSMEWCYATLQIVVLLLEGLEGKLIIGDLGAAMIVCGMEPRCTHPILIREKQAQLLELCTKIRMGRRVISHPPAPSEDGSEAAHDIPVGFSVEEIER